VSVVVGCEACGEFLQVSPDRASSRCSCGGTRSLVMTSEQNRERWRRGISLEQWLAAPHAPATYEECERRRQRPCPHLRCRHHQGVPGQGGCDLDCDGEPQTLVQIARVLGASHPSTVTGELKRIEHRRGLKPGSLVHVRNVRRERSSSGDVDA
jgi:hypothetical protein